MRAALGLTLGVLASIVLVACDSVWVVGPPYYRPSYTPGETGVQGSMPVVVRGNPFPDPNADVALAVADAMQGNTWWPTQFVASTVNPVSSYRVVVLFAGPPNMNYPELCSAPVLTSAPEVKGRVPVYAALCKWDVLMAASSGTVDAATQADPGFRSPMAALARELFPLTNPDDAQRGGNRVSLFGPRF
jgi:hypothetical protein